MTAKADSGIPLSTEEINQVKMQITTKTIAYAILNVVAIGVVVCMIVIGHIGAIIMSLVFFGLFFFIGKFVKLDIENYKKDLEEGKYIIETKITKKRYSSGKKTTYYFNLDQESIKVNKSTYAKFNEGDQIRVHQTINAEFVLLVEPAS